MTVSGNGAVYHQAELVMFHVLVTNQNSTQADARKTNNIASNDVVSVLKDFVEEKDFVAKPPVVRPQYNNSGKIRAYNAQNDIFVKLRNMDNLYDLISALNKVDEKRVQVNNIAIGVTEETEKELSRQARKLAYEDAVEKAKAYCEADSLTLIGLDSLNEFENRGASYGGGKFAMAHAGNEEDPVELGGEVKIKIDISATFHAEREAR